jgi:hypothetical protein
VKCRQRSPFSVVLSFTKTLVPVRRSPNMVNSTNECDRNHTYGFFITRGS